MSSRAFALICIGMFLLLAVVAAPTATAQTEDRASAWIQFGEPDQENGLHLRTGDGARLTSRGGRFCRGTNAAGRRHALHFAVAPSFVGQVMPVRVTVEYWDEGADWFLLRYRCADPRAADRNARTEIVRRTDTKTWRHYTFHLPDAEFGAAGSRSYDFFVYLEPLDQHERLDDVLISRVEVTKGGIVLAADPDAVSADGATTCALEAHVYDRTGAPVADDTDVAFSSTLGRVTPRRTTTVAGRARATFTGSHHPGTAVVTARWNDDEHSIRIPMLAGRGPVREISYALDDFSGPGAWRGTDTPEAEASLSTRDAPERDGRPTARIHYRFGAGQYAASLYYPTMIPGRPRQLTLWMDTSRPGNQFDVYCHDATRRELHFNSLFLWQSGWRQAMFALDSPMISATEQDYTMEYPLTFDRFRLLHVYWTSAGADGDAGTLDLQDLVVTTQVPESALVWPEVLIGDSRLVEEPGDRVPVTIRVRDFSGRAHEGLTVALSSYDFRGERTRGPQFDLDLAADEVKLLTWAFTPMRTGRHQVEATIRGDGVESASRTAVIVGME